MAEEEVAVFFILLDGKTFEQNEKRKLHHFIFLTYLVYSLSLQLHAPDLPMLTVQTAGFSNGMELTWV